MRIKFSIGLVGVLSIIGSMGTGVFWSFRDQERLNAAQKVIEPVYQPKVWSEQDQQILRTLQTAGVQTHLDYQIGKVCVDGSAFNAQLVGANLRGIYAEVINFSAADLSYADLSGAKLRSATFSGAKLVAARLIKADLKKAYLADTDLRNADLRGANLEGARLYGANLEGVDLRGANLIKARLKRTDLKGVIEDTDTRWPRPLDGGT